MYKQFITYFRCIDCNSLLDFSDLESTIDWVESGFFHCSSCNSFFPVIDGVPRFLPFNELITSVGINRIESFICKYKSILPVTLENRFQLAVVNIVKVNSNMDVSSLYSYQWEKYSASFNDEDRMELVRLTRDRLDKKYIKGARILDVGGGQGRFTQAFLERDADEVVCLDYSSSIIRAAQKVRSKQNCLCLQANMYNMPFNHTFDLVVCIGVLQHLNDPTKGFLSLVDQVAPGGRLVVWCYGESSIRSFLTIIRRITRKLPIDIAWHLCTLPAMMRFAAAALGKFCSDRKLEFFKKVIPFSSYYGYSYHYLKTNTFDHLCTPVISFFTQNDVNSWLDAIECKSFHIQALNSGQANASWLIEIEK